jgi:hypothetical protein
VPVGTDEHPLLLANLPPSDAQRRLALGIVAVFALGFIITAPLAHTQLPRVDAWIPAFATALVITDLLTSVLLFAQFSIVHRRSLLVLAIGYFFSALIVIPYSFRHRSPTQTPDILRGRSGVYRDHCHRRRFWRRD